MSGRAAGRAPRGCCTGWACPHAAGTLRRTAAPELRGLILLDLPDHDSSDTGNRAQVDRMLELVDAVIWVVDPEKYADAVLHERYLRPLAGYAEVMFVVLNQVDRLPGDAADQVVDDLRRLLDEDGLALGEHGEPGRRGARAVRRDRGGRGGTAGVARPVRRRSGARRTGGWRRMWTRRPNGCGRCTWPSAGSG